MTDHPKASFRLLPWPIEATETVDALGPYAETYWAPILCPTAYLLGRRLVIISTRARVADGETCLIESALTAAAIGVMTYTATGPNLALFNRALKRLTRYKLVKMRGANLEVRTRWPRLPDGLLSALPLPMQHVEADYWARESPLVTHAR